MIYDLPTRSQFFFFYGNHEHFVILVKEEQLARFRIETIIPFPKTTYPTVIPFYLIIQFGKQLPAQEQGFAFSLVYALRRHISGSL